MLILANRAKINLENLFAPKNEIYQFYLYNSPMKFKYLQILLITAIGAYFIGATDVNDLFVIPFAAVLMFVLVNTSRRGKK